MKTFSTIKKRSMLAVVATMLLVALLPGVSGRVSAEDIQTPDAPNVVGNNSDLQPGCGIKVVLVLDASASIDATEQGQVRTASNAFLSALVNTPSQVAIVEFATLGDVPVGYATVTPASIASGGVFGDYLSSNTATAGPQYYDGRNTVDNGGVAYTNWDYAFHMVNGLATAPDLVVFMTDGDPTARGGYGGTTLVTSTAAGELAAHLNAAEASANLTKLASGAGGPWGATAGNQGLGSHIFSVGVGAGVSLSNLYRVQDNGGAGGNTAFSAGPPSNFSQADYVVTNDFIALQEALRKIAEELCSSSLTVTKLVDMGNGQFVPQAGWTFTGNVTPSTGIITWKSPCVGGSGACGGQTLANGQVFFQWLLNDVNATTTSISIAETQQAGYEFVDAACTVAGVTQSVTQATTFTVSGIARTAAASCTVRNRLIPTSVTLGDFSATCNSAAPVITWETLSEANTTGFNLWRSESAAAPETQLNASLIAAHPGSTQGYSYTWTDSTAQPGRTYYYWLEDVDINGATHLSGPTEALCSSPTAVTVSDLEANSSAAPATVWWPLLIALIAGSVLAVLLSRRAKTA